MRGVQHLLKKTELGKWSKHSYESKGVTLYKQCPKINKSLTDSKGLTEQILSLT